MNHLLWRVPVYILAAIGVPIGLVAFVGMEALLGRLWMAIGLFVVYEVLLYLALLGPVGQGRGKTRFQKTVSDIVELGRRIGYSSIVLFSARRRRYLRHVREQCRGPGLSGILMQGHDTPALQELFVEPFLALHPSDRTAADPTLQVPKDLRTGRHTIWTCLRSGQMGDQSWVVTGPAGSGKTTLLRHVALALAAGPFRQFKVKAPLKHPMLLVLRDHAEAIAGAAWPGDYDLVQAGLDALQQAQGPDLPAVWFERLLGRGRFLVLLDGLDEVADPALREPVVAWVQEQMRAYPRVRFIATSRPMDYRAHPLDGVTHFEIRSFDRDQVERLVRSQYLAYETEGMQKRDSRVATRVEAGARDLLKRIWSTFALSELAANPLFLGMLATLHRRRHTLPERRPELVAATCGVLSGERRAVPGEQDAHPSALEMGVLGRLAYEMMSRRVLQFALADAEGAIEEYLARAAPEASAGDVLRDVARTSSLLVRREKDVYAFAQRIVQEYLAAIYAKEQRLELDLAGRVGDIWWHETLRFYAAQSDASTIVSHCLAHDPPSISELVLAIDCMTEANDVFPDVRVRFDEVMQRGAQDRDPERRRLVSEALLAHRLRSLVPLGGGRSADTTLIAHAEYQLFLDEKRAQGQFCRPDHWTGHTFPQGTAQEPVLGVRYTDALAFCEWLTEREGKRWRYRLPEATELEDEIDAEGSGYWALDGGRGRCVGADTPLWHAAGRVTEQWLDDAIAVDLARACTRAVDLATIVGRASALDLDLAADLSRARDRAIDLAGACNRANDSAINLATIGIRDVAGDLAGARAMARTRDLSRELAGIIARASARACAIARDIACARDRARARSGGASDLVAAIDDAGDSDLASGIDLVRDGDLASVIDLTRAVDLARTMNFAGALNLASARAVDRELARKVAVHLARTIDHGSLTGSAYQTARDVIGFRVPLVGLGIESVDSLLQYVCRYTVLSLWLAETSFIRAPSWWARHVRSGSELDRWEKLEQLQGRLRDLYIDLCIWDARVKGAFPPFEGIRIVRECLDVETLER